VTCYIWSTAFYGAETWTLWKVDQKYVESFEMWCWRRMEKMSWTDHVRNEEVLQRVKEEGNILHTVKRRKATWIGNILRRNCRLKHVIEGKIGGIELTIRQGGKRKQLLNELKETRECCKLKEEALDRVLRKYRFGRSYGHVLTQYGTNGRMNE
jgi:hypothetical protein